jgi:hypothetical protein
MPCATAGRGLSYLVTRLIRGRVLRLLRLRQVPVAMLKVRQAMAPLIGSAKRKRRGPPSFLRPGNGRLVGQRRKPDQRQLRKLTGKWPAPCSDEASRVGTIRGDRRSPRVFEPPTLLCLPCQAPMGRDWPCRLVKKIADFDHRRESGGPAVTLKWCSRWCSGMWSTTCGPTC